MEVTEGSPAWDPTRLFDALVELVDSRGEARWIFRQVCGLSFYDARAHGAVVPADSASLALAAAHRRSTGEPLQYAIGVWPFRDLQLNVDARVLIPRPETELLVQEALDWIRSCPKAVVDVFDLGTGSAAIALSIAKEGAKAMVVASDLSKEALEVAKSNLDVQPDSVRARVVLLQGDWFGATDRSGVVPDLIVSNPPYIGQSEYLTLDPVVRQYEPALALVGGESGTEQLFAIVEGAVTRLQAGGALMVELAPDQADEVAAHGLSVGFSAVKKVQDLSGRDRIVVFQR